MTIWHNNRASILSLEGDWDFSLGNESGKICVPATWEAQGYSRHIDGEAHYKTSVVIPPEWDGQRIQLQFDAVSYHADVYVNDTHVGSHAGLWTAFAFDITDIIQLGETNSIHVVVTKPGTTYPMRESLAGFLPDVATTFGGIWGAIQLMAFPDIAFSDIHIRTDTKVGKLSIKGTITQEHGGGTLTVAVSTPDTQIVYETRFNIDGTDFDIDLEIDSPCYWHPSDPYLYVLDCTFDTLEGQQATIRRQFGFRILSSKDEQLLLNDKPIVLRGILNWGWYPEILCPAPDEVTIRDEFQRVRDMGYNMVKLCLLVPSPLYFQIADEVGMLLWLELPMWLPQVTERMREQARIEYADILAQVHLHPSIVIYSLGCELGQSVDAELLNELDKIVRYWSSDVLACDNSGSGEAYGGLSFDYADFNDYHFYSDLHYFTPLLDHFRRDWRPPRPWIFGEFCDADDYTNLAPIAEAFGGELPWWKVEQNPIHKLSAIAYSQQSIRMAQLELGFDDAEIEHISRQQSFVVRKIILEKVRGRAGMGGYVVTGLRDTPLASSSMFDALGQSKYSTEQFKYFNNDTVLTLEQGRARQWANGGDRPDPIDLFNRVSGQAVDLRVIVSHSGDDLTNTDITWRLTNANGDELNFGVQHISAIRAQHRPHHVMNIKFRAPDITTPIILTLQAELGNLTKNQWTFWIYPKITRWLDAISIYDPVGALIQIAELIDIPNYSGDLPSIDKLLISSVFTDEVANWVRLGGQAIVLQPNAGNLPAKPCPFWRESIKLLYNHPVLYNFPHAGYADLQFYHLAGDHALDCNAIQEFLTDMDDMKPIIRRLDARQFTVLDYLAEINLSKGRMLISSLHFTHNDGDQTNGLQTNIAGQYLLNQMIKYLAD